MLTFSYFSLTRWNLSIHNTLYNILLRQSQKRAKLHKALKLEAQCVLEYYFVYKLGYILDLFYVSFKQNWFKGKATYFTIS